MTGFEGENLCIGRTKMADSQKFEGFVQNTLANLRKMW